MSSLQPAFSGLDFGADFQAIARLAAGEGVFTLSAVLAIGLALIYMIRLSSRLLCRWLPEKAGLFSRLQLVGITLITALVAYIWFRRLLNIAPLLTIAASAVFCLIVLISQISLIGDLVSGAILLMRSNLTVGAHVAVGERRGLVERMGSLAVVLRDDDGQRLFIPNRVILSQDVAIQSSTRSVVMNVTLDCVDCTPGEYRERLHRAGVLCPFRQPGSPVQIAGDGRRFEVSFRVPDAQYRADAERFMRKAMHSQAS